MHERISTEEAEILRSLARQVQEISQEERWKEKIVLWKKLNSLKKTRPVILCTPQGGWEEIIPPSTLKVKDPLFRSFEYELRQRIYRSQYILDDAPVTDDLFVPYEIIYKDWVDNRTRPFSKERLQAAAYQPIIEDPSDFDKLHMADFEVDYEKSNENFAIAHELFDGILNVHNGEPYYSNSLNPISGWGTSMIDIWCEIRGLENFMYDVILEPQMTKDAMELLTEGQLRILKKGEELGIWQPNNNGYIWSGNTACGSNGLGFTDELPADDYSKPVKLKDCWNYSMAQECTGISSDMLEEFVLPYQARIQQLFPITTYGCCENNDTKWEAIKRWIPNLREVSVPEYCNYRTCVEHMEDKYVLCFKPKPAGQIISYDPEKIRREMKELMEIGKDSHIIIRLNDLETVCNDPDRVINWTNITMELAREYE